MKVLIADGCGYLGSYLAFYIRERRHDLVAMETSCAGAANPTLRDCRTIDSF